MTDIALGVLIGSVATFIVLVAIILLMNHGPKDPIWRDYEDNDN